MTKISLKNFLMNKESYRKNIICINNIKFENVSSIDFYDKCLFFRYTTKKPIDCVTIELKRINSFYIIDSDGNCKNVTQIDEMIR